MYLFPFCILVVLVALTHGCSKRDMGIPRIAVEAISPDGTTTAFVRNHITIDGPDQSIWLRRQDSSSRQLRRLGPDSDWCDVIVWSADSSRVGFLVQDAHLFVYDATSEELVADEWLAEQDGYPPTYRVWILGLSDDGGEITFRSCRRRGGDCSDQTVSLHD